MFFYRNPFWHGRIKAYDADHRDSRYGDFSASVGEENQPEADDETGDEGGEPFQQCVEERVSLSWRCGIVLHAAGLGGYAVPS